MRGCLFILILAALVVAAAAWFGSPVLASSLIAGALSNGGFHAASSEVRATSDPPPRLLLGHADRVEIVAADVEFRSFRATGLDLVLTDVDLIGHDAERISGRITDAELTSEEGIAARADVTVDGSAAAADASIVVSEATVEDVVAATVEKRFGINVTSTSLVAPDIIRIKAGTSTVDGHLAIDGDAITLDTPLGSVAILRLDPAFPLRLRSATVEARALHIDGTLDANTLIGG